MLERDLAGELRKFLEDLDENHLAKILLRGATRAMGTHDFGDERIERAHKFAGGVLIVLPCGRDERAGIEFINHFLQVVATLRGMTSARAFWLQTFPVRPGCANLL